MLKNAAFYLGLLVADGSYWVGGKKATQNVLSFVEILYLFTTPDKEQLQMCKNKMLIWWSWGCHGTQCTLIRFAGDTKLGVTVDRLKSGAAVRREPGPGTRLGWRNVPIGTTGNSTTALGVCTSASGHNELLWLAICLHSFDTSIIQGAKLRTGPCFPCAFVDLNLPGSNTFKWLGLVERWAVLWWCYPVPFFLQCLSIKQRKTGHRMTKE